MPLDEKQKALLEQLGINKKLNRKEKERFKNFEGRRGALLHLLDRLNPVGGTAQDVLDDVKEADEKAKKGDFEEAYKYLEEIESKARAEVNGYAATFTQNDIVERVSSVLAGARDADMRLSRADSLYQALLTETRQTKKVSSFATLEVAALYLKDDLPPIEEKLREQHTRIRKEVEAAYQLLVSVHMHNTLMELPRQLRVVQDSNQQFAAQWTAELARLPARLIDKNKEPYLEMEIYQTYDTQAAAFEAALRGVKDLGKWQNGRDPEKEGAGPGPANPELLKALQRFQARQDEVAAEVKKRLENEQKVDRGKLATTQKPPPQAKPPDTFSVADFVTKLKLPPNFKNLAPNVAQGLIAQAGQEIELLMKDLIQKEPDGDELFDLALKTPEELRDDLARALGIAPTAPTCGEDEKKLLDGMARAMAARVQANYPNKAGATQTTFVDKKLGKDGTAPADFTLNGKKFGQPKYLASGGLAHALRYEDQASPGQFVVLKALKNPKQREEMVYEAQMHRQASGAGHPNVIGFKGLVFDANGVPYVIMENAPGGAVEDLGQAVAGAAATGALTEEARHIFTQHVLRQAVEGLAHVQASNLVHRDIKPANYLLGEDGTVKVADFGSARRGDDKGATYGSPAGTTQEFGAPENYPPKEEKSKKKKKGKNWPAVTGKADTYSLGAMMAAFASPNQGIAEIDRGGRSAFRTPASATAFDRLCNAMLDDDPNKRPTLEAVQESVYLTDVTDDKYDPAKVQALVAATMAYARNFPEAGRQAQEKLLDTRAEILKQEANRKGATDPGQIQRINEALDRLHDEEKKHQQDLQKALSDPNNKMKPHIDALAKASAELGGHDEGDKVDLATLKFEDAFQKAMAAFNCPYVEPDLVKALGSVDAAPDPAQKKSQIVRALGVLDKCVKELGAKRKDHTASSSEKAARQQAEQAYDSRYKELMEERETVLKAQNDLGPFLKGLDDALAKEIAAANGGPATAADYRPLRDTLIQVLGPTDFAQDSVYTKCQQLLLFLDPTLPAEDKVKALHQVKTFAETARGGLGSTLAEIRATLQKMVRQDEKEAGVKAALAKARAAAELALKESDVATAYRRLRGQLQAVMRQIDDAAG
jgi:serine/threonine protein kinase